jgi:hypothetical protein
MIAPRAAVRNDRRANSTLWGKCGIDTVERRSDEKRTRADSPFRPRLCVTAPVPRFASRASRTRQSQRT